MSPPYYLTDKGESYRQSLKERLMENPSSALDWEFGDLVVLDSVRFWEEVPEDASWKATFPNRHARTIVRRLFEAGYLERIGE